jgi:hypothetical protein
MVHFIPKFFNAVRLHGFDFEFLNLRAKVPNFSFHFIAPATTKNGGGTRRKRRGAEINWGRTKMKGTNTHSPPRTDGRAGWGTGEKLTV